MKELIEADRAFRKCRHKKIKVLVQEAENEWNLDGDMGEDQDAKESAMGEPDAKESAKDLPDAKESAMCEPDAKESEKDLPDAIEDKGSDSFSEEETYVSEHTRRREKWQKGRQDWSCPTKIAAEVKKVTVDTLPEVNNILRKHGWAILRDVTTAFGPKAQLTREQRNFITKCK